MEQIVEFLSVTNREVSVVLLGLIIALHFVLFYMVSKLGLLWRTIYGFLFLSEVGWLLSWYTTEGVYVPPYEPLAREFYLFVNVMAEALLVLFIYRRSHARELALALTGLITPFDLLIRLFVGLVFSGAMVIGYLLYGVHEARADREDEKIRAIRNQTAMLNEVRVLLEAFEARQDSTLRVVLRLSRNQLSEQEANRLVKLQQQAIREAKAAKRSSQQLLNQEKSWRDSRGIQTPDKQEPKGDDPNWVKKLLDRFRREPKGAVTTPAKQTVPDSLYVHK